MKKTPPSCLLALLAVVMATSCTMRTPPPRPSYGSFPDVHLLPPEQANPITWATNGVLHGKVPEEDWRTIIGLLSRIPGLTESDRQLLVVDVFEDPPLAVRIYLGNGSRKVTFVKTAAASWRIAGIYLVDSGGQQK